ncbi:hypothetical protein Hanom_Chr08g00739091 [Helianthus anomalus]
MYSHPLQQIQLFRITLTKNLQRSSTNTADMYLTITFENMFELVDKRENLVKYFWISTKEK